MLKNYDDTYDKIRSRMTDFVFSQSPGQDSLDNKLGAFPGVTWAIWQLCFNFQNITGSLK